MKTRAVPDILRIGVLVLAVFLSGRGSLRGAIYLNREARDLAAQKDWSDAIIAAGSVVMTNVSFELSGRAVRYDEPYSPPFSSVSTNTVRFKADLENLTSTPIGGLVLEMVLIDVESHRELLHKNVFLTTNLPPHGHERLSRLYVDEDIDNAIFAANSHWEFRLSFVSHEPYPPPKPLKRWLTPRDALEKLRPIYHWTRFADLPYDEPSRKVSAP